MTQSLVTRRFSGQRPARHHGGTAPPRRLLLWLGEVPHSGPWRRPSPAPARAPERPPALRHHGTGGHQQPPDFQHPQWLQCAPCWRSVGGQRRAQRYFPGLKKEFIIPAPDVKISCDPDWPVSFLVCLVSEQVCTDLMCYSDLMQA